jgi:hypothetical protein
LTTAVQTGSVVKYDVKTLATDYNGKEVQNITQPTSAQIEIAGAGEASPSVSSSTPNAQLLFAGQTNKELVKFTIDAKNDTLKLTDLYVFATGGFDLANGLSNIKLLHDGNVLVQGNPNGSGVSFENITDNNKIDAGRSAVFSIVADINAALNKGDIPVSGLELYIDTSKNGQGNSTPGTMSGFRLISDSNGETVTVQPLTAAISKSHLVVRTAITVAKTNDSTSQSDLGAFTITPNGYKAEITKISTNLSTNLTLT